MAAEIRILRSDEGRTLDRVAPGVFDAPIEDRWSVEFFRDPRHHLAVAVEDGVVVGFASGVHYVHPDKAPELWINEVGVAPTHQNCGLGRGLLAALLARGAELGCVQAWVLTDAGNLAARRMYAAAGGREAQPALMFEFPIAAAPDQERVAP